MSGRRTNVEALDEVGNEVEEQRPVVEGAIWRVVVADGARAVDDEHQVEDAVGAGSGRRCRARDGD